MIAPNDLNCKFGEASERVERKKRAAQMPEHDVSINTHSKPLHQQLFMQSYSEFGLLLFGWLVCWFAISLAAWLLGYSIVIQNVEYKRAPNPINQVKCMTYWKFHKCDSLPG